MNEFIDIYCERGGPGLWEEPLNAVTNAAFFIAALFAFLLARRESALNAETGLLIALLVAIGAGSTLFHTFAVRWAALADVIPILAFQIAFLVLYGRRVIGLGRAQNMALLAAYIFTVFGFGLLPQHWLNGSISYIPALLFLGGLGVYHYRTGKKAPRMLLAAAGVFVLSLTFRTLDMAVCPAFPFGVHFMWHVLNGVVLYLVAAALIVNYRRSHPATAPL